LLSSTARADPAPIRFVPAKPRCGDLAIVYVLNSEPTILDGSIRLFEHEHVLQRVDARRLRGVIAVPLDLEPGIHPVAVDVEGAPVDGEIEILDRPWAESVLTVNKKFTDRPNAALRRRIAAEERAWAAMFRPDPEPPAFVGGWIKPVKGSTTSAFGGKRMFNGQLKTRHLGLDLDGDIGDPILAGQSGFVVMSADRFSTGGTVVIDHGNGLFTAYFHMSLRKKKTGDRVRAGELIGLVGATGRVTGPHLHLSFMVRTLLHSPSGKVTRAGLFVDPERALRLIFEGDPRYLVLGDR